MPTLHEPIAPNGDRNLALFCDFENIALGVRDSKYADQTELTPSVPQTFDVRFTSA